MLVCVCRVCEAVGHELIGYRGFAAGLSNGDPVFLVYGMLLSITGNLALAASLAKMASVCPIAGAQYHWTYMFAPRRAAPFITWMQEWITVFAWQAVDLILCK